MRKILGTFFTGAVLAFGAQVGMDMFNKLKNPVTRVELKKKCIRVKDAIVGKEES